MVDNICKPVLNNRPLKSLKSREILETLSHIYFLYFVTLCYLMISRHCLERIIADQFDHLTILPCKSSLRTVTVKCKIDGTDDDKKRHLRLLSSLSSTLY